VVEEINKAIVFVIVLAVGVVEAFELIEVGVGIKEVVVVVITTSGASLLLVEEMVVETFVERAVGTVVGRIAIVGLMGENLA
jgi:hypothetical protein